MKKKKNYLELIKFGITLLVMFAGFVSIWAVNKEKIKNLEEGAKINTSAVIQMGQDVAALKAQNNILLGQLKTVKSEATTFKALFTDRGGKGAISLPAISK